MKKIILLLALVSSTALAAEYDTAKFCARLSSIVGGSPWIEQACRKQEAESQAKLVKMKIPDEIDSHCTKVGGAGGGSYRTKLSCIEQALQTRGQAK